VVWHSIPSPVIGAGNITLDGNGLDLTLGTVALTANTTFEVTRYITVDGALTSTANLELLGDKNDTGVGGIYVTGAGSITADGNPDINRFKLEWSRGC